jgi:hypothetical protein
MGNYEMTIDILRIVSNQAHKCVSPSLLWFLSVICGLC